MMQKNHRENLNLLFYDFNYDAHLELQAIQEETDHITNGQFSSMMTNTGTNFYTRFGDRLPTRETKSRRGRFNYNPSAQGQRVHSLAENTKVQLEEAQMNKLRMSKEHLSKSTSRDKLVAIT